MDSISQVNPLFAYPYLKLTMVGASEAALKGVNQQPSATLAPTPSLPLANLVHATDLDRDHDGSGFSAYA
jgi:hypothetical protein